MPGKLTTHVLDTVKGKPAEGVLIELHALRGGERVFIAAARTHSDGRTTEPMLTGETMKTGRYELTFHVGDYFGEKSFLDEVPVRFQITDATQHYHVPLVCSPWAYSTYRGS